MDDGPPVDARFDSGMLAPALVECSADDPRLAGLELIGRFSDNEAFPDGALEGDGLNES